MEGPPGFRGIFLVFQGVELLVLSFFQFLAYQGVVLYSNSLNVIILLFLDSLFQFFVDRRDVDLNFLAL